MITCDYFIKNGRILLPDMTIANGKSLIIKEGKILKILETAQLEKEDIVAKEILEDSHLLWMPGLIDGHFHTSQQLLRGRLLDEKPVIWKRINVPFESKLTEDTMKFSAEVASMELIKNGTTAFLDAGGPHMEVAAETYLKTGIRAGLTWQTTDSQGMPKSLRADRKDALNKLRNLYKNYHNQGSGQIHIFYSVTNLMACSEEMFVEIFREAKEKEIGYEAHMNEYATEVNGFIEKFGCRPVEYLAKQNLLSNKFVAPHCIFLSETEMDLLKECGAKVIHCPFSNCGKGIPNTPALLNRNIPVGFGTDGTAHGGADIFREMRTFRSIMNASYGIHTSNPEIMPAETLLSMATNGGAQAFMIPLLGKIEEQAPADFIAIDLDQPHITPTNHLVHTLVESVCGQDVKHTMVNGKFVMKNRELLTIDEEKIKAERKRLLGTMEIFQKPNAYFA